MRGMKGGSGYEIGGVRVERMDEIGWFDLEENLRMIFVGV